MKRLFSKITFFLRLWKAINVEKVSDGAGKAKYITQLREATYGNVIAYDPIRKRMAFICAPEEFMGNLAVKKFTEAYERAEIMMD